MAGAGTGRGAGGATLARASANFAGVLSAGPWRLGRWNSAWQVTASMFVGTSADTWCGVHGIPSACGAGGSTTEAWSDSGPGASPGPNARLYPQGSGQ